jgi:hypothetical protein
MNGGKSTGSIRPGFMMQGITMRLIKSPMPWTPDEPGPTVFLAGSIEMGQAEDWQSNVELALADLDVVLLNPRRDEWDATWTQAIGNAQFREQVEWELTGLERASVVAMYFAPSTKAPITLLELGLTACSGKLIVCCPDGYWRKGNVEVVCCRYGVPMVATLPDLASEIRRRILALTTDEKD